MTIAERTDEILRLFKSGEAAWQNTRLHLEEVRREGIVEGRQHAEKQICGDHEACIHEAEARGADQLKEAGWIGPQTYQEICKTNFERGKAEGAEEKRKEVVGELESFRHWVVGAKLKSLQAPAPPVPAWTIIAAKELYEGAKLNIPGIAAVIAKHVPEAK